MSEYLEEALEKLDREYKGGHYDRYAAVMKKDTLEVLKDFCRQDGEFAQAVVQGGSFADCMKAVAKGIGQSISDLEAFKRAVQFYFPGAEIRCSMTIDLTGSAAGGQEEPPAAERKPEGIVLDFTKFL